MIKEVNIQNFQSHKKTNLKLSSGVNIIIGSSDSGKSSILRALRWAIWNRPSGADFRPWDNVWDGKDTVVEFITRQGTVIRKKGKQGEYIIKQEGKEDLSLKAFKTDVPEEVSSLLAINEINLQQQLDSPFLLSKSPGEVAVYFNKIAKLDKIDLGTQNVQKVIRELTSDLKYKREEKKRLLEEQTKFEYLEDVETKIEVLEQLDRKIIKLSSSKNKLMDVCATFYDCRIQVDLHQQYIELDIPITQLLTWYEDKEKIEKKKEKLLSITEQLSVNQEEIEENTLLYHKEKPVLALLQLYKDKEQEESLRISLESLVKKINNTKLYIKSAEEKFKLLTIKFNKEFPQVCPLCGIPVPHDH